MMSSTGSTSTGLAFIVLELLASWSHLWMWREMSEEDGSIYSTRIASFEMMSGSFFSSVNSVRAEEEMMRISSTINGSVKPIFWGSVSSVIDR